MLDQTGRRGPAGRFRAPLVDSSALVPPAVLFVVSSYASVSLWFVINVPDAFPEHSKPSWRALASALNEECPECSIVVFEPWAYRPVAYDSDKRVSSWRDYKKTTSQSRRVALAYRPLRRSELSEMDAGYRTLSERSIRWTRSRPDANNIIKVRLLEPGTP